MAKKRVLRTTSDIRYRMKMERQFRGQVSEETAKEFAAAATSHWSMRFGEFHSDYVRLKEWLSKAHPEVPVAHYAYYKAFLSHARKQIPGGYAPEAIVDYFQKKAGLDPNIMREILTLWGFVTERTQTEVTTKQ